MKKYIMNIKNLKVLLASVLIFGMTSCSFEDQTDPNRPSLEGVLTNA
ncbi:MAG: RagB/SusD family nutrient uptake outer membrane protein, partial [Flavobacteriaceae bacterium]